MDIKDLYIGASVMYKHKPYIITFISKDKVGLCPYNWAGGYDPWYNTKDIITVRISLVKPIPIGEVILGDNRFSPAQMNVGGTTITGLSYTNSNFSMFLCKDSKFIDVYRVFINSKDYGTRYYTPDGEVIPILLCFPITYLHELTALLKGIKYNIRFKLLD